jgi:uncharacterized protein (DUF1800 family)
MAALRTFFLTGTALLWAAASAWAAPAPALQNRLTWGLEGAEDAAAGDSTWLDHQLHPGEDDGLPAGVADQIAAMEISQKSLTQINTEVRVLRQAQQAAKGTPDFDAARKAYQGKLNDLAREAQTRSLLRDLYSKNQLKEQLTWFWMNHFNVHQNKGEIRAFIGDYEETVRAHALGKFRDLLFATMIHPAMLQYLDNNQNAKGHINENYAREIMELHTLGVGSGYSQQDVQELARILTGLGLNLSGNEPNIPPIWRDRYRAKDLFEFNPMRHDFGEKTFLGGKIGGEGLDEAARAAVILSLEPPTAMFVSRKLAEYFCCDAPPAALVRAMAATFKSSDGEIAAVLKTMFAAPEFKASLNGKLKDPIHYVVSAVRAAYGDQPIVNAAPLFNWLNRMGEPLYGHETPDGYPMDAASWSGPGQMETRFEFAQALGHGGLPLFAAPPTPAAMSGMAPAPAAPAAPQPVPPALLQTAYYPVVAPTLSSATQNALSQGTNPGDKAMLLLASPEFMRR